MNKIKQIPYFAHENANKDTKELQNYIIPFDFPWKNTT